MFSPSVSLFEDLRQHEKHERRHLSKGVKKFQTGVFGTGKSFPTMARGQLENEKEEQLQPNREKERQQM